MPELVTSAAPPRNPVYWISIIAYWIFTLLVAFEMVAGGIWDLLRIEYVRVILQHLGYPIYLLFIIGVWKIPCAVTVLVPRFLRLKEWAYAGALFNYTGAAASHLAVGDGANRWSPPLALAAFTLASWALRPPERRLARASPATGTRPVEWFVAILIVGSDAGPFALIAAKGSSSVRVRSK
jgi:DoxX-like family